MSRTIKDTNKELKRSRTRLWNPFDGSSRSNVQEHKLKKHKKPKHKNWLKDDELNDNQ